MAEFRNGAPPTKAFQAPSSLKSHSMWSQTDYDYFRGKGYSDAEIKVLWDRDAKDGNKPVDWSKGKYFKPYNSIPFANGVARAQQEIANRMQASGVRVENVHTAYAHGPIEIRFEADSKYYGTTDKWATKLGPFGSEDEARKALGLGMQRETMRRV